jgi:hypothetical protein
LTRKARRVILPRRKAGVLAIQEKGIDHAHAEIGRFDLTLVRGSDGKLGASVSVGTDMGDYNAKFSTMSLAADKLAGAYDYPPDPQGEVTITGSFDPKNATGTWSLGAKGQPGGQAIAGTWKVSKQ